MVTMAKKAKKDKTDAVVVTPEEAASVADNTSEDDHKPKKKKKKNKNKASDDSLIEQMDTTTTEDVSETVNKEKSDNTNEIQPEAVISDIKKPKNEKGSHVRSAKERMKVLILTFLLLVFKFLNFRLISLSFLHSLALSIFLSTRRLRRIFLMRTRRMEKQWRRRRGE